MDLQVTFITAMQDLPPFLHHLLPLLATTRAVHVLQHLAGERTNSMGSVSKFGCHADLELDGGHKLREIRFKLCILQG